MKAMALLIVLAFLTLAPSAVSQVPDDKLIVPGQRIGKWTLEMTMAELVQMNGRAGSFPGTASDFAPGTWLHDWTGLGLRASTLGRNEQRIASLIALDTTYKAAKGLSVDASQEAVEAAYGKPTAITSLGDDLRRWIYDDLGLFFVIGATIGVFRPGTAKQLYRY